MLIGGAGLGMLGRRLINREKSVGREWDVPQTKPKPCKDFEAIVKSADQALLKGAIDGRLSAWTHAIDGNYWMAPPPTVVMWRRTGCLPAWIIRNTKYR